MAPIYDLGGDNGLANIANIQPNRRNLFVLGGGRGGKRHSNDNKENAVNNNRNTPQTNIGPSPRSQKTATSGNPHPYQTGTYDDEDEEDYEEGSYIESYAESAMSESPSEEAAHVRAIQKNLDNNPNNHDHDHVHHNKLMDENNILDLSNVEFERDESIDISLIHPMSDDGYEEGYGNAENYAQVGAGFMSDADCRFEKNPCQTNVKEKECTPLPPQSSPIGIGCNGKQMKRRRLRRNKKTTNKRPLKSSHFKNTSNHSNHSRHLVNDEKDYYHDDDDDDGDSNDKYHNDKFQLQQDIFTFFFISPIFSWGFLYATCIYTLQLSILILAMTGLLKDADHGNPLHIPLHTEVDVLIAQFAALLVSVFTAKDIIHALDVFQVQYSESVKDVFPNATRQKWYLSHFLRLTEGCLGILVAFFFIVQSTDVLDLFLDFAVVQFVSELDDIAFFFAEKGYSIFDLKLLVHQSKKIQFQQVEHVHLCGTRKRIPTALLQKVMFVVTFISLLTSWGYVQVRKDMGVYYESVCQRFEIKFDDMSLDYFRDTCGDDVASANGNGSSCPESWVGRRDKIRYTSFNDVYEAQLEDDGTIYLQNHRPVYYQRGKSGMDAFGTDAPPGRFYYCVDEEAWVFAIEGVSKGIVDESDGGCNWLMKSLETKAHSLHEVSTDGWVVWTGILDVTRDFSIDCVECQGGGDGASGQRDIGCTYHGQCMNEECSCDNGWMGLQCETCVSCKEIDFWNPAAGIIPRYRRFDVFNVLQNRMQPLRVYGRPVYYKIDNNGNIDPVLQVILYAGRRYIVLDLIKNSNVNDVVDVEQFLESVHSTWDFDTGDIWLFSELTDAAMPSGLKWMVKHDEKDEDNLIDMTFDCVDTNEKKICGFLFNDF